MARTCLARTVQTRQNVQGNACRQPSSPLCRCYSFRPKTLPVKSILALAILAGTLTLAAQDADRARTEALVARAAERLKALQAEADHLASEARTILGDLRKLELERQIKEEEFRRIDTQANA